MHPPLIMEKHPMCAKYMQALVQCHKDHNVARWWGACNDASAALTKCLKKEKTVLRAERQEQARQKYREMRQQRQPQESKQQQHQQQQHAPSTGSMALG